jgi:hypothetical protein
MTTTETTGWLQGILKRFRPIFLAPVLAFIALGAWAYASPIGAGPDDDYHVVSIWCAGGGSAECQPGSEPHTREVDPTLPNIACYAQYQERSGACQTTLFEKRDGRMIETARGNFVGEYPPVYYAVMHLFTSSDIQASALAMRLFNAALFVALATALVALLPLSRRGTLLWGWLVALVPLGMFIIPSNNPSGWAVTGVGTAFLAMLGWLETTGRRRWALGTLYLLAVVMAAGARGDAAVYAVGATVTAAIIGYSGARPWWRDAWLPAVGMVIAVVFFATAGQSGVASSGFTSGGGDASLPAGEDGVAAPLSGLALAAFNLLSLPFLWTGVWGTWGLGWLDTAMPAIVPWAAGAAVIVVAFAGLGRMNWRKAISVTGVLLVLVALPVYVLTAGGDKVGANLQPRYLLPLITLFLLVLLTEPSVRSQLRFTRLQTFAVLGALAIANFVALHVNIRRYVTGADQQGPNLDSGAEWWWSGLPLGPTAVWIIGALAYGGVLALLWGPLRRPATQSAEA